MSRAEYEEDLHAELGYRTAGRREVSQREWFSLRGNPNEVAPTPKAFKVLAKRLAKLRSRRRRPDVYRAQSRRYEAANKTKRAAQRRARYWKNRAHRLRLQRASYKRNAIKRRAASLARYYAKKAAP